MTDDGQHCGPRFPRHSASRAAQLPATEEIELLDLLAQFPAADPDELLALVARNSLDGRIPMPPSALRDVAYALLDSGGPDSELVMSVLRLTHHLVGSVPEPAHLDLYNWATALAARHERTDRAAQPPSGASAERRTGRCNFRRDRAWRG